jgi:hypothetical protein
MTAATERLVDFVGAGDCFDIAPAALLPLRLQAANERLQGQIGDVTIARG